MKCKGEGLLQDVEIPENNMIARRNRNRFPLSLQFDPYLKSITGNSPNCCYTVISVNFSINFCFSLLPVVEKRSNGKSYFTKILSFFLSRSV